MIIQGVTIDAAGTLQVRPNPRDENDPWLRLINTLPNPEDDESGEES